MTNNIKPESLPVCHTYEEAEEQYQKTNAARQALLKENLQLLQLHGVEEAERKAKEEEDGEKQKLANEKQKEYEAEVS